jgi:hypothetical protein
LASVTRFGAVGARNDFEGTDLRPPPRTLGRPDGKSARSCLAASRDSTFSERFAANALDPQVIEIKLSQRLKPAMAACYLPGWVTAEITAAACRWVELHFASSHNLFSTEWNDAVRSAAPLVER